MRVIKIVLTGGPCAGKTKTLDAVVKYLTDTQKDNFKVFVVPESATELINTGIIPNEVDCMFNFQDLIFLYQTTKEDIIERAVEIENTKDNYIILYDRGVIDNKAYLNNQEEFNNLLRKYNYNELSLLDKYDLVIDLISLANCDEKLYESTSNPARYENLSLAKERDVRTTESWLGQRNIKIFNSNRPIQDKIDDVISLIDSVINCDQRNEINKYYIEGDLRTFSKYNENNSKLIQVNETYLDIPNKMNYDYIVRRKTYNNVSSYTFTIKKDFGDVEKIIQDELISKEQTLNLIMNNSIKKTVSKYELTFTENKQIFKVNFFDDYTTLEYEENKFNNNLILPKEIRIISKVGETEKPIVKNKKIC